jgi:tripeptidyl-peptidase-1
VPTDFYLQPNGRGGFSDDLLAWAAALLGDTSAQAPKVWSVSYGEGVNGGNGGHIQPAVVHHLDVQMQKLGLAGVSVLFASGDSGVYSRNPLGVLEFHPSFPACLPSVTAVGSTQLTKDEQELSGVSFSGGGFTPRAYFTRRTNASWQDAAVTGYLNSGVKLPASGLDHGKWDRNGRAIPDVSSVGVNFQCIVGGAPQGVSGTSASTPLVAGIIGLINAARERAGKSSLGFLNPFLYHAQATSPTAFRDILKGHNNGGGLDALLPGFYATKGWDPVGALLPCSVTRHRLSPRASSRSTAPRQLRVAC